jgi:hypothetical protein
MNLAEQISHHAQALPSSMQQELWAFVQFLEFRLQQQTLDAANTAETNSIDPLDWVLSDKEHAVWDEFPAFRTEHPVHIDSLRSK